MSWLINFLILLLPTQLGKHFWPNFAFVLGQRIDYLSPTIYLTDLIIFLIFATAFFKFKIWQFKWLNKIIRQRLIIFLVFIIVICLNVFLADRQLLALYGWLRIFQLIGLFLIFRSTKSLFTIKLSLLACLVYSAIIGLWQFSQQSSVGGWLYWLGERPLSLSFSQVAKETLSGRLILPAYASFAHPNSLAGFLLLGVLIIFFLKKKTNKKDLFIWPLLGLVFGCFVLTFSYVAFLSLAGTICFLLFLNRLSFSDKKFFSWLSFSNLLLLGWLQLPILSFFSLTNLSISRRVWLSYFAWPAFFQRPLIGLGLLNFIPFISQRFYGQYLWLQPVHNFWYLSLAEGGLALFLGLVWVMLLSFKKALSCQAWWLAAGLLAVLLTGAFDHYWITLPQNRLLVVVLFALIWSKYDK